MTAATVSFVVDGKPVGKGRPRFDSRRRTPFTPEATAAAERAVRRAWQAAGSVRLPGHTPIDCLIECQMKRPATHWRKDGTLSAEGVRNAEPCRTKPDVDNAAKLILDALEGCAYPRDVAITRLSVSKRWGTNARVLVVLRVAEEAT